MARFGALIVYTAQSTQASGLAPVDGLLLLAGAVLLGLPGWLAYTGKWRRWTSGPYGRAFPYFPFGLAWMCAGGILLGVFSMISALGHIAADIVAVLLGIPGIAMFCCGLAFLLRTPKPFLPLWYREFRQYSRGPR
jgi:hypothetical protein